MSTAVELVQPAGSNFHQRALGFPARIKEVTVHGVRHGAATALFVTHIHLQPRVDLHMVAPGFSSRAEVLKNVDIERLITNFGVAANGNVVVVKCGASHYGHSSLRLSPIGLLFCKGLSK